MDTETARVSFIEGCLMERCSVGLDGGVDEPSARKVMVSKPVDAAKARRVLLGNRELPDGFVVGDFGCGLVKYDCYHGELLHERDRRRDCIC